MACRKLSELSTGDENQSVCVRVSRIWHYRGPNESGPLLQSDMLFIDGEGNCITASISAHHVNEFHGLITEGKVYQFRRFRVVAAAPHFRAVGAKRMIKFSQETEVHEMLDVPLTFPQYTFNVTPFSMLPAPCLQPRYFTDVIGALISASDLAIFISPNENEKPMFKRHLTIRNLTGAYLRIILKGECAARFKAGAIVDIGQEEPAILAFVGTLVKRCKGKLCLTGRIACRWYVNEDTPLFNIYRAGFCENFRKVRCIPWQSSHGVPATRANCSFFNMLYPGDDFVFCFPPREYTPPQRSDSDDTDDSQIYESAIACAEAVLAD